MGGSLYVMNQILYGTCEDICRPTMMCNKLQVKIHNSWGTLHKKNNSGKLLPEFFHVLSVNGRILFARVFVYFPEIFMAKSFMQQAPDQYTFLNG